MSLGVAFKGPEGIVLAADSRVTITTVMHQENLTHLLPSTFDNATKLLEIEKQKWVGVVTYGRGGIGDGEPRTAHSFLPELDNELPEERLSVERFAQVLGEFYLRQWNRAMPPDCPGPDMTFLVGGYDTEEIYGRIFQVDIPSRPEPLEWNPGSAFGLTWGG